MIGPHHSIIWRLTSTGHGAAACTTDASEDRPYLVRVSLGSFSIRTNIVGTTCVHVTRYRSIMARNSSASKCSMITDVPPRRCIVMLKRSGAEWYSGAGDRYTLSPVNPNSIVTRGTRPGVSPSGASGSGVFTPLGWPVVPDE